MNANFLRKRTVPAASGCWNWVGSLDWSGYARVTYNSSNWKASRLMWTFTYGEIPDSQWVLHRCDNRRCINPLHLFLGDVRANCADMCAKNRHGRAKLNPEKIAYIRASSATLEQLAKELGTSTAAISLARTRKSWRHLP